MRRYLPIKTMAMKNSTAEAPICSAITAVASYHSSGRVVKVQMVECVDYNARAVLIPDGPPPDPLRSTEGDGVTIVCAPPLRSEMFATVVRTKAVDDVASATCNLSVANGIRIDGWHHIALSLHLTPPRRSNVEDAIDGDETASATDEDRAALDSVLPTTFTDRDGVASVRGFSEVSGVGVNMRIIVDGTHDI